MWRRLVGRLVLVLGVVAVAVLLHRLADAIRGSPVRELVPAADGAMLRTSTPGFAHRAAALAGFTLQPGHAIEVLTDVAIFDRLFADLRTAERSITFMGYYCESGRLAEELAALLLERAREGVEVRFLGDGFGCRRFLWELADRMESGGIHVATFRRVHWYSLHRSQHRLHSRTVVIDGTIGYTGGFGISDKWVLDHPRDPLWRDTGARVVGPAVATMQGAFLAAWAEATGELLLGEVLLPPPGEAADGAALSAFLHSSPAIGTTPAERYIAVTLAAAERTLYIANSYFVPTPLMRRLLTDAARRGVDVRLLLPGERTDIPSTRFAGRGFYEELLRAGVRVFEYQPAMMHAKTVVVDGAWSGIGSLNMDNRSIRLNEEGALVLWDARMGARMDSLFLADLERAREITLAEHRRRPLLERVRERIAIPFAPLL